MTRHKSCFGDEQAAVVTTANELKSMAAIAALDTVAAAVMAAAWQGVTLLVPHGEKQIADGMLTLLPIKL